MVQSGGVDYSKSDVLGALSPKIFSVKSVTLDERWFEHIFKMGDLILILQVELDWIKILRLGFY
jgi:hypothetical protein